MQNSLIGLVVCSFRKSTKEYRLLIIPIVMPPFVNVTLGSSEKPDSSFEGMLLLQRQVAYFLNLQCFAANGGTTAAPINWTISSYNWDKLLPNDTVCPIVQSQTTNILPPLKWDVTQDGHLVLVAREGDANYTDYAFAFNLVTMQSEWFRDTNYYFRNKPGQLSFFGTNASPAINDKSMFGNENGWMGRGGDVYGFGYPDIVAKSFVDDYNGQNPNIVSRSDLFNAATWARAPTPLSTTFADINAFNTQTKLWGLKQNVLFAPRKMLLIPSRYYTVQSNAITKHQRKGFSSNCKVLTNNSICGVVFPSYKTEQSGTVISVETENHPVIHVRSNDNLDNFDLVVFDEYEDILDNLNLYSEVSGDGTNPYRVVNPSGNPQYNYYSIGDAYWYENINLHIPNWRNGLLWPGDVNFQVPTQFLTLNPDPVNNPNGECLIGNFQCNGITPMFGEIRGNNASYVQNRKPITNKYSTRPQMWITHFVRIIGHG